MKKFLLLSAGLFIIIGLASWGVTGHRTVAMIAANHLTPQAKAAVTDLLNGESMADVSNWADEVRNTSEYKHTAPWHYIILPLGLNWGEFDVAVKMHDRPSPFYAIVDSETILTDNNCTKEQRSFALKLIVHLVGDIHQPMNILPTGDGETDSVKTLRLHTLWESSLLDKQGMSNKKLAGRLDKASTAQIKQWQSKKITQWMWESYQISSQQYKDMLDRGDIDKSYYQSHVDMVNERIVKAGIRLAGLLNDIFKDYKASDAIKIATEAKVENSKWTNLLYNVRTVQSTNTNNKKDETRDTAHGQVSPSEMVEAKPILVEIETKASPYFHGQYVQVTDLAYSHKEVDNATLLYLGADYPNQLLTIIFKGNASKLASGADGKTITVIGFMELNKGKAQIEVKDPASIIIK
jgi:hypothetical protein